MVEIIVTENGNVRGVFTRVISASLTDSLNGECTFQFSVISSMASEIFTGLEVRLKSDTLNYLFNVVKVSKSLSNGIAICKSRIVGKYDIWLAHWTNSPDCPSKNNYGQTMWQWGLDRISGYDVDGDICFTDYGKKNPVKKTIDQLADEVLEGKWDNGAERYRLLTAAGYDYNTIQKRVNEKLYRKTTDEIAVEVIAGLWGNGAERKEKLTEAGYDYSEVQKRVNEMLR